MLVHFTGNSMPASGRFFCEPALMVNINTGNHNVGPGNALFGTNKYINASGSIIFDFRHHLSHGMKNPYADAVCSNRLL